MTRPFDAHTPLPAINPLGKVPTLLLESGEYCGRAIIYEYLDLLHRRRKLHPPEGAAALDAAPGLMADGLFDSFVLLIIESWRPREQQRADYLQRAAGPRWSQSSTRSSGRRVTSGSTSDSCARSARCSS
ncbi:MAG: hypothetical protein U1F11_12965 [Steroidobacteraceae bacterium]